MASKGATAGHKFERKSITTKQEQRFWKKVIIQSRRMLGMAKRN